MQYLRATCDDFAVKSDCVDFLFVVLSFVKRRCQLFLYFYQIGNCDPLKTAQNGADLCRTGCERATQCTGGTRSDRESFCAARRCAVMCASCRYAGYQKKKDSRFGCLSFGNRQRPILPGRVQVRYQTLALGSSLTLPSSYARYSVLSCDSGGTLPCCYQKKKRQHSLSLLLVTGNVLPSQVVSNSVLSAQKGLTAVFGMGTGVSPSPLSPVSLNVFSHIHNCIVSFLLARHSLVM